MDKLIEQLVNTKRAADGKVSLMSCQGQGMDGFTELANYRSIIAKIEVLLNPRRNEMIQPVNDKILIEVCKEDAQSKGGIYIPDKSRKVLNRGKVLAVGPGKQNDDGVRKVMSVKVGDVVYYGDYAGNVIDTDRIIMSDDDILAIQGGK